MQDCVWVKLPHGDKMSMKKMPYDIVHNYRHSTSLMTLEFNQCPN